MKKSSYILASALIAEATFITGIVAGVSSAPRPMPTNHEAESIAYAICMRSHNVQTMPNDWEDACGMALALGQIEFECSANTCEAVRKENQ